MTKIFTALAAAALFAILPIAPASADHHANATETVPDPWSGFRAHGTEPFWGLTINPTRLIFEHAGVFSAEAERPPAQTTFQGTIFISQSENPGNRDFIVLVEDGICSDGMTDMVWPKRVRVFVDAMHFSGCGGDASSVIAGDEWRIMTVSGEDVPESVAQTIQFDADGGLSGFGGCNRFMGRYELGGGISFGPIASTRRACINPEISHFENSLLTALGTVYGLDVSDDGVLTLLGADGVALTARR